MKKFYYVFTLVFIITIIINSNAYSQLSGSKSIPGDYATICAAITDLNSKGVGTGGVTFNVLAGYTETLASRLNITATGTAANPIIFQKSGAGNNPKITAYTGNATPASLIPDGIWSLQGSDYVTINGIDLFDPNTTNNATMEYGYGLFKNSSTDGCQNVTITNCTITLSYNNNVAGSGAMISGSIGILVINSTPTAAITSITITSAAGSNSYNKFYSNTIQNCNYCVAINGYAAPSPFTLGDTGNDLGGASSATGNQLLNFGGAPSAVNPSGGIYSNNQWGSNISYNNINNNNGSGSNHIAVLRGIFLMGSVSANINVNNNTIVVTSSSATSQLTAIDDEAGGPGASNTININNNNITTNYASATSGSTYGIYNTLAPANLNINGNILNLSTSATSVSCFAIYQTGAITSSLNENNNTINSITLTAAATSASVYCIYNSACASTANLTIDSNTFQGVNYSGTTGGTGTFACIYNTGITPLNEVISGNNFNNISVKTTGAIYLISSSYSAPANGTKTIQNNYITGAFNNTVSSASAIYAYYDFGSSPTTASHTISGNNFSNITTNSSGIFYGIFSNDGSLTNPSLNFYNNTISNVNHGAGALYGFYLNYFGGTSGTPNGIYNNTVSNLSSTGSSVYGLYIGVNNLYVNLYGNTINTISTTNASGAIYGVYLGGTTNQLTAFKNNIYNLSGSQTGSTINGIYILGGSAVYLYNNFISDLYANTATGANAVNGIYILGGTTVGLYYNSVFLNATSTGTSFGSSGVYKTLTTIGDFRNNIIVNTSTPGSTSGNSTAIKWSSTYNAAYYAATSNNNCLYAGIPSANKLIFFDGINSDQTIAAYKTRVNPKENLSFTELPPFNNIATKPYDLHMQLTQSTQCESGGVSVTAPFSITTDYDGDIRNVSTPDVGADEFIQAPIQKYTGSIVYNQASTNQVIQGSTNQEILRLDINVLGNSGTLNLNSIAVNSNNSNDADISAIKLYRTSSTTFSTANPIGTLQSFSGGVATFTNLNYDLPVRVTYVWVAYDISISATQNNVADAIINANQIDIGGIKYPAANQDPAGNRLILNQVSIGNGVLTQGYPFYLYYGYSRSASIYTAVELGSSAKTLTKLSWYVGTSAVTSAPLKIYLKSTSSTTITSDTWANMISGATLVYDASNSFSSTGWKQITLSSTFDIYATENLMVLTEANYGSTGAVSYPYFSYTTATNQHAFLATYITPPTTALTVSSNRPNIRIDYIVPTPVPMVYSSSTTTQTIMTPVLRNVTNQQLIGIKVVTSGFSTPITLSDITFNTNGSSNPSVDISTARLWYTGISNAFATTTQYGSDINTPSGSFKFTGSQALAKGTNYFWLTYDISTGAAINDVLDAECNTMTIDGVPHIPDIQAPAGTRIIKDQLNGTYLIGSSLFERILINENNLDKKIRIMDREVNKIFNTKNDFKNANNSNDINTGKKGINNSKRENEPDFKCTAVDEKIVKNKSLKDKAEEVYYVSKTTGKEFKSNGKIIFSDDLKKKYGLKDNVMAVFNTITSAVSDLNALGINGNVEFQLTDVLYSGETFPISFGNFSNTGNFTTTIRPTLANTVITGTAPAGSLLFYVKTKNIVIDGDAPGVGSTRDLSIINSSNSGWTFYFGANSSASTVKNCVLKGGSATSGESVVQIEGSTSGIGANNNTIDNCEITQNATYRPGYGIVIWGNGITANNNLVNNCDIHDIGNINSSSAIQFFGNSNNNNIVGNRIYNTSVAGATTSTLYGINLNGVITGNVVEKNNIYDLGLSNGFATIKGIYLTGGIATMTNTIRNNIINLGNTFVMNGASLYGIDENGWTGNTWIVYYNTIRLNGTVTTGTSYCVSKRSTSNWDAQNNIAYNNRSGGTANYGVYFSNVTGTISMNYNDNYVDGTGGMFGYWNASSIANITNWKNVTGKDTCSISGNPGFTSASNLQPNVNNPACWNINGKGLAVSIGNDISGNPRSTNVSNGATDIGAYEFVPNVAPNDATYDPATILDGQTTSFTVAGNVVVSITWHTGSGTLPTGVSLKYRSGESPSNTTTGTNYGNLNTVITPANGSGFTYDMTYYYTPALLGKVSTEANTRFAKYDVATGWVQYFSVPNTNNKSVTEVGFSSFSTFAFGDANNPLPVNIQSFTSNITGRNVKLSWITTDEQNNKGFDIERKNTADNIFNKIGFVGGKGKPNSTNSYSFEDSKLNSGKYQYRLKQIDVNGNFNYIALNNLVEIALPSKTNLSQNYPNPFNPTTKIDFDLPADSRISLKLYDLTGREVKVMLNGELRQAGYYTVELNANNLASGTYFYRFIENANGKDFIITKKMMLIK
jgi:hypothetical protein